MGCLSWAYLEMSLPEKRRELCKPRVVMREWSLWSWVVVLVEDRDLEKRV